MEDTGINQQHQELIGKLYELRDSVWNQEAQEIIEGKVDAVVTFTRYHFEYEEQLLKQYGYPELKWHIDKHKELIQDALKFKEKLKYGKYADFLEWFNHWPLRRIQAHIAYADNQAEEYIKQFLGK